MKKILTGLCTMGMVLFVSAALVACAPHKHSWGEWTVTTPATCTEAGEEIRVCKDDESHKETREIPALGHAYGEWTVTTLPTYEADGTETRVCARDAAHKETRPVAKLLIANLLTESKTALLEAAGDYKDLVIGTYKDDTEVTIEESINHLFEEDWGIKSITEATTPIALNEQAVKITAMVNYHKDVVIPANIKVAKEQAAVASADGKPAVLKLFFNKVVENFYEHGEDAFDVWAASIWDKTVEKVEVSLMNGATADDIVVDGFDITINITDEIAADPAYNGAVAYFKMTTTYKETVAEVYNFGTDTVGAEDVTTTEGWQPYGRNIEGELGNYDTDNIYYSYIITGEDGIANGITMITVTLLDARTE